LEYTSKNELPRKGIITKIFVFIYRLFENLSLTGLNINRINHNIVFFIWTKNQRDAILPIKDRIKKSTILGFKDFSEVLFPLGLAYIYSVPFFGYVFYKYLNSVGYIRKSYLYNFDKYWLTYGYYIVCDKILSQYKPSIIVVSNDHTIYTRALTQAAKYYSIKTVYVPHASVTKNFPLLSYNYALLDGYDTLYKYANMGISDTIVFLVGNPKYDQSFILQNKNRVVKTIGISISTLDQIKDVENVIAFLLSNLPDKEIIIRPHPKDDRISNILSLIKKYKIRYSDSKKEHPIRYLQDIDILISSASTIQLEAAIMNVVPIHYEFSNKNIIDYYEYIKNGLIQHYYMDKNDLLNNLKILVKEKPNVRQNAKYYNYTIGTIYDGLSAKLCAKLIKEIENNKIDYSVWTLDYNVFNLKCYRLNN